MSALTDSRNVIKDNLSSGPSVGSMQKNAILMRPKVSEFSVDLNVGLLFKSRELSLISHIENLKQIANGTEETSVPADVGNSSNLPSLTGNPLHQKREDRSSSPLKSRPNSSLWAIDPGTVPGNLRSDARCPSLTLEDVQSRVSSVSDKLQEGKDDMASGKNSFKEKKEKKARTKSSKKMGKRKDSTKHILHKPPDHRTSSVSLKVISQNESQSNHTDLDTLTALCQSIKIHDKGNTNNVKKSSKSSTFFPNKHHHHKITPARSSLNNALAEYSKKASTSATSTSITTSPTTTAATNSLNLHQRRSSGGEDTTKSTKVFQSQKQSGMLSESGGLYPCAPPATPTPEQLKKYDYVPSMQDIRAQRSVKHRLQLMEARAVRKEKKKQDVNYRLELMSMKEKRQETKRLQRLEIYALNKVMTELEHARFHQFMSSAGSNLS